MLAALAGPRLLKRDCGDKPQLQDEFFLSKHNLFSLGYFARCHGSYLRPLFAPQRFMDAGVVFFRK
jgi:hypothetical protein